MQSKKWQKKLVISSLYALLVLICVDNKVYVYMQPLIKCVKEQMPQHFSLSRRAHRNVGSEAKRKR